MLRKTLDSARPRVSDDTGAAAPTPLFLAYVTALVLAGVASFGDGIDTRSAADFLLLASIVTGAALVLFAGLMIWSTRGGQRAAAIAAARPGALVLRAMYARGLRAAARSLRVDARYVPLGLTLLADESGFEVWGGSAEHPVRLGRSRWDTVADVRMAHVTRLGRAIDGLVVTIVEGDTTVDLPFAVIGAGFGGLWAPTSDELERFVVAVHDRRAAAVHS